MGRWSMYPMDSDNAWDAKDILLDTVIATYGHLHDNDIIDEWNEKVKEYLENITLYIVKEKSKHEEIFSKNLFVLPYSCLEYGAVPKDDDLYNVMLQWISVNEEMDMYADDYIMVAYNDFFFQNYDSLMCGEIQLPLYSDMVQRAKDKKAAELLGKPKGKVKPENRTPLEMANYYKGNNCTQSIYIVLSDEDCKFNPKGYVDAFCALKEGKSVVTQSTQFFNMRYLKAGFDIWVYDEKFYHISDIFASTNKCIRIAHNIEKMLYAGEFDLIQMPHFSDL